MSRFRLASILLSALALVALLAPAADAAQGISDARALTKTTTGSGTKGVSTPKEGLTAVTQSPADGQTVSGSIVWQVNVGGGLAGRVDFAVDGTVTWSQSAAPYVYGGSGGTLDTTKLSNGSHTLTATAYGSKGVKAVTQVKVKVANGSTAPPPEPAPAPAPEPELPAEGGGGPIYWGATIGSQLTGSQPPWDMSGVTKFEEETGKQMSLINFFQPFSTCSTTCSYYNFPTTPLNNIRAHGSVPVLSWSSQSIPSSLNEPNYQLSDLIEGHYDTFIREFATKAKEWGHPFFLRFDWEMNGTWFPWSEGVNGNKPGEYVAAWRHVHEIFTSVGATNVNWVWCPNVDYNNSLYKLNAEYPGDSYVDWIGLDGYNWGTNPAQPGGWKTFDQIYRTTYKYLYESVAPSKPMMIGEMASSEDGGSKAEWIRQTLNEIPVSYPKIRALLWFDKFDSGMDWPIETSAGATAAFASAIQNPAYAGNAFAGLSGTSIQPAS